MSEENKTYSEGRSCSNCNHYRTFNIPTGTTIEDYFAYKKCTCCGCNIVGQK